EASVAKSFLAFFVLLFAAASANAAPLVQLYDTDPNLVIDVSLVFKLHNGDELERLVAATQTPGNGQFHRFIGTAEFASRFAPSPGEISRVQAFLSSFGITPGEVYADRLIMRARGTVDAFNRAFSITVTDYNRNGHLFHRPKTPPVFPKELRDTLL